MSESTDELLRPERIYWNSSQMDIIDHFIGHDEGTRRSSSRRVRPTGSSECGISLVFEDEDGNSIEHDCILSVVAVHNEATGYSPSARHGDPVAVAEVWFDDDAWYLLVTRGSGSDRRQAVSQRPVGAVRR